MIQPGNRQCIQPSLLLHNHEMEQNLSRLINTPKCYRKLLIWTKDWTTWQAKWKISPPLIAETIASPYNIRLTQTHNYTDKQDKLQHRENQSISKKEERWSGELLKEMEIFGASSTYVHGRTALQAVICDAEICGWMSRHKFTLLVLNLLLALVKHVTLCIFQLLFTTMIIKLITN